MPKKRKDGRYQRKITLSDGRQKMVYGRTLAELNAAADAVRAEDRQGVKVGNTTLVGEWAKIWLEKYKSDLRPNTVRMYRDAYNVHIMPELGAMMLREVKPVHVRAVMKRVADKSESLQNKVLLTMRQIFETARQNGLIVKDPTEGLKITPHARPEKPKVLTPQQVKALLTADLPPKARAFVGLCLYCGLRKEEALGLQWGDLQKDRLTVCRAVSIVKNQPEPQSGTKNASRSSNHPSPSPTSGNSGTTPLVWPVCNFQSRRRSHDRNGLSADVGTGNPGNRFSAASPYAAPYIRYQLILCRCGFAHCSVSDGT